MSDIIVFPKGGIQKPDGMLNPAGHSLIGRLIQRVALKPAESAVEFLRGGKALIRAQALFGATKAEPFNGGGAWAPDLGTRLHFKVTIGAPLTILAPVNVPDGDAEPFFSVWVTQDSVGGWPVAFGAGFRGSTLPVLTNPGDMTLLGFNVMGDGQFTGWAVRGVQAGT